MTTGPWASVLVTQRLSREVEKLKNKVRLLEEARRNDNYHLDKISREMVRVKARLADITSRPLISGGTMVP